MLKKVLRYLSRIFLPYLYTPEGFRLTERPFVVPENLETLDASQKRAVAICNLFANQKQSITETAVHPLLILFCIVMLAWGGFLPAPS
jgi:hypothetical protein